MPLTRRARGAFSAVAALGVVAFAHPARAAEPTKTQCIDANEAAQPLRKSGKLRAAEERLLVCVRATCPAVVRDDCAQRLTEVRAAEPTVVFVVKDESEHDLTGVRVTMDGVELATKLDGTAIAVDPGEHHFAFEVEGRLKEERTLMLNEGDRGRQERIVLVSPVVETTTPAPPPKPPEPEPSAEGAPPPPGRTQRQIGIALGGVGLAGVVVSSIFGIAAKNLYDHAVNTECGPSVKFMSATECLPNGITDSNAAHNYATGSTVGFVVSGALLAAGATLYFMAPRGVSVTVAPTVGAGGAGLGVGGGW